MKNRGERTWVEYGSSLIGMGPRRVVNPLDNDETKAEEAKIRENVAARLKAERLEAERLEAERLEAERSEAARLEAESAEAAIGKSTVKGVNVKIVLYNDPDFGEILKVLPASVENIEVLSNDSKDAPLLNRQSVSNLSEVVFGAIVKDEEIKRAFNKITNDKSLINKFSMDWPAAAQIARLIKDKQLENNDKYKGLLTYAQKDIRSYGAEKWYENRGSIGLYKDLLKEPSGLSHKASTFGRGIIETMKEGYIGNPENLHKETILAITNFLNANRSLRQQFREGLEALKVVINDKTENKGLGLDVSTELLKGIRSKLRRLTANLGEVQVVEGFPKWKWGIKPWRDPEQFEKDLLNRGLLGGKNTRKNKNTKRRKSRKH
jgi:hypothetical protein